MSNNTDTSRIPAFEKPTNKIANSIDNNIYDILFLVIIYHGLIMINKISSKDSDIKTEILNKKGIEKEKLFKIEGMTSEQKILRKLFIISSLLIKSATYVKAPYLFALYSRIHGFTR